MDDGQSSALAKATASEAVIAEEAAKLREGKDTLTPELFMQLYPLLCKPIPSGFIQTVGRVEGKPYASTGVRSVQVQIDRMNNVLTPMWWWDEVEYEDAGKVAEVTVYVGDRTTGTILVERSSRGGVARGTGAGNIYKGSYTNAAKPAFARVGPGHEVYLGAADLDPDVNEEAATAAEAPVAPTQNLVGDDIAKALVDRVWKLPEAKAKLQLAAGHATGRDVGDCSTKPKAVQALSGLTFDQAEKLDKWVDQKATEAGDDA